MVNTGQCLECIHQNGGRCAQQGTGVAGHDGAVFQFKGGGGQAAGGLAALQGCANNGTILRGNTGLLHQQLQLAQIVAGLARAALLTHAFIIAANDLLLAGAAAHGIVRNAVAGHVHAHVRGGFIGARTGDQLEHGVHHGENLNVAVVVYGGFAVGLQMERVDHVHIVQIGGGGLVGQIYRVL